MTGAKLAIAFCVAALCALLAVCTAARGMMRRVVGLIQQLVAPQPTATRSEKKKFR